MRPPRPPLPPRRTPPGPASPAARAAGSGRPRPRESSVSPAYPSGSFTVKRLPCPLRGSNAIDPPFSSPSLRPLALGRVRGTRRGRVADMDVPADPVHPVRLLPREARHRALHGIAQYDLLGGAASGPGVLQKLRHDAVQAVRLLA